MDYLEELEGLFAEAKASNEFDFILTLINYRGMGSMEDTTLYEWFEAIPFYHGYYHSLQGKEKTRMGLMLYSTFFENSDFYNILGSLCRVSLGFKGSSYLYFKTKKYERLLGTSEKVGLVSELLEAIGKNAILVFFADNHFKGIRNTFFHSAYSLSEEDYCLEDGEAVTFGTHSVHQVCVGDFLYPLIDRVYSFFEKFKTLYLEHFNAYQENKLIVGRFPGPVQVEVIGSGKGLGGFKIRNSVSFFGKLHDSGIYYDEKYGMWTGLNIVFDFPKIETMEIDEQLTMYEARVDMGRNNTAFMNLMERVGERKLSNEMARAVLLLLKFGDIRYQRMEDETQAEIKNSLKRFPIPYYQLALELNPGFDLADYATRLKALQK